MIYRAGWPSKFAARAGLFWVWVGPYVLGWQR